MDSLCGHRWAAEDGKYLFWVHIIAFHVTCKLLDKSMLACMIKLLIIIGIKLQGKAITILAHTRGQVFAHPTISALLLSQNAINQSIDACDSIRPNCHPTHHHVFELIEYVIAVMI